MNEKINDFYNLFNEQFPEIEKKIKIAKGENLKRIKEFKEDILRMKEMIDKLNEVKNKKGIRAKLKRTKILMVHSRKAFYLGLKILRKYKKYDSDIRNFPV